MRCRPGRLQDRPIGEHQRRAALACACAVLLSAAAALASAPGAHDASRQGGVATRSGSTPVRAVGADTSGAEIVGRAFLAGYLSYAYGHDRARQIVDASRALIASLAASQPRTSPVIARRRPEVIGLGASPAPGGTFVVSAVVNDGALIDYGLRLMVQSRRGRLLVTGVGQG